MIKSQGEKCSNRKRIILQRIDIILKLLHKLSDKDISLEFLHPSSNH